MTKNATTNSWILRVLPFTVFHSTLYSIYSDSLGFGVGATYTDGEVKVSLKDKNDFTLYHELTHFIDFSFNNNSYLYNLYNCDGNYIVKKGYDNRCTPINIETNFITEAGAEVYSGKYFTNELEAYSPAPLILEALEYIYGSDEVNEWFFVSDNYFKKIWFDMGYSEEEVLKIINSLSNTTKVVQPQHPAEIQRRTRHYPADHQKGCPGFNKHIQGGGKGRGNF